MDVPPNRDVLGPGTSLDTTYTNIYHNPDKPPPTGTNMSRSNGVIPQADYTWRPPSPPHIQVPQVAEDVELNLQNFAGFGYDEDEASILRIVAATNQGRFPVNNWRYEDRRHAQKILDCLYLGPCSSVRDVDGLRTEGITMLLAIRDTKTALGGFLSGRKAATELGISAAEVDVAGQMELISSFPKAISIINQHLIDGYRHQTANGTGRQAKVLVFCESGNERSGSVVAAFLMYTYHLNHMKAIEYVQSQRFCIAFDDRMKNLLLTYSDILVAQRDVSTQPSNSSHPETILKAKRGRHLVEDDGDMNMDQGDDESRFGGRLFTPFGESN